MNKPIVEASGEIQVHYGDITDWLDFWSVEELEDLAEGDFDGGHLGQEMWEQTDHRELDFVWPEINKSALEDYIIWRKRKEAEA